MPKKTVKTAAEKAFDKWQDKQGPSLFKKDDQDIAELAFAGGRKSLDKELKALRDFKAYVHQRLDEAGVDAHEEQNAINGCRIGARLDDVLKDANQPASSPLVSAEQGPADIETLGDALPKEMARVRQLVADYRAIGPTGTFGATLMEATLRKADQAVVSGDVVAMIQVYQELQSHEG